MSTLELAAEINKFVASRTQDRDLGIRAIQVSGMSYWHDLVPIPPEEPGPHPRADSSPEGCSQDL